MGEKKKIFEEHIKESLPYDCCAISLLPFKIPVCTQKGHVFDLENIVPYIKEFNANPVTGEPLSTKELIKLKFSMNSEGQYFCPVTYKVFTNNSHIVAIKTSGNVYSYNAIQELNIKAKNWTDLLSGEKFTRKDILTIQDPQRMEEREITRFQHLRDSQLAVHKQTGNNVNIRADAATSRILQEFEAKMEEKRKRQETEELTQKEKILASMLHSDKSSAKDEDETKKSGEEKRSKFTSGLCSRSLTSSIYQPTTKNIEASASKEELLEARWLEVRKLGEKGYVQLHTSHGDVNLELHCDIVPRTCDNFLSLCETGYYDGVPFHRIIPNFMIQGGDPTGTGEHGESIWKKKFRDEVDSRLVHDARGLLSMANSGPNTNGSQFFITFAPCQHLDYKHSLFGRVVGGMDTLDRMEAVNRKKGNRPIEKVEIISVDVFQNPFRNLEEKEIKKQNDVQQEVKAEPLVVEPAITKLNDDSKVVGKYLPISSDSQTQQLDDTNFTTAIPSKKKMKLTETKFGDFSSW